jgi:hypothetical protein
MTKLNQQQQQQLKNLEKKNNLSSNSQKKNNKKPPIIVSAMREKLPSAEADYLFALQNPFSDRAGGCRVPDRFPFPTVTQCGKFEITVTSSASGTFQAYLFPCAPNNIIVTVGTFSTTGIITASSGVGVLCAYTTDAGLASLFDTVRTVSGGWRIRNAMPFNTVQGSIVVTPFICADISINQATQLLATGNQPAVLMSGTSGGSLAAPGAREVQCDQLVDVDLCLNTRPIDPTGYAFRTCENGSDQIGGADIFVGTETFSNTTGLVSSNTFTQASNCKGLIGYVVKGSGFPNSAVTIEIESTLHLEGCQVNGSGNFLEPFGYRKPSPMGNVEGALSRLTGDLITAATPLAFQAIRGIGKGILRGIAGDS